MFINFLIHRQYSLFLSLGNSAPRARKHGALYNCRFMKIGISSKKIPRFSLQISTFGWREEYSGGIVTLPERSAIRANAENIRSRS